MRQVRAAAGHASARPNARQSERGLRRNVRRHLSFEQCNLVFEEKLALLEALELKLVLDGTLGKAANNVIEVSVLHVQLIDALPEHFDVGGMYHGLILHTDLTRPV